MALYAISAVYFAGVMVRLMLTLTPVVCMLSAIAFSSVFEHYLGDDMKRENPPAEDSSDEDDKRNQGNLYDKVSEGSKVRPRTPWWINVAVLSLPYKNVHGAKLMNLNNMYKIIIIVVIVHAFKYKKNDNFYKLLLLSYYNKASLYI